MTDGALDFLVLDFRSESSINFQRASPELKRYINCLARQKTDEQEELKTCF